MSVPAKPFWTTHDRPVIQTQIESEILRLSDELERATGELADLSERSARAEVTHKLRYFQALIRAEGKTMAEREARAHLRTAVSYEERKLAEALRESGLERCRSLRSQLSAVQTVGRLVGDQT